MPWGGLMAVGIAGALAPIAGGIIGQITSSGDRDKANKAMQEAQDYISSVNLPASQAREVLINKLKSAGVWKPEMEKTIDAGISKVSQITEDPALRQKQTATLDALQHIADTGMTATGRAEFNSARAKAQQDAEAKRQQILQQMQARGMGGSGNELAMQLQSAQGGANEESAAADRIAAEQEQAKMSALSQLGTMAGQVRGQDFGVNKDKAAASDAMQMFNVNNQVSQQARNVASTNEAAKYDTMNNQRLDDLNTTNANNELYRQRAGEQQDYTNQLNLAQTRANAALGQASQASKNAQNTAQGWQTIGSGVGSAMTSVASAMGKTKNAVPASASAATPTSATPKINPATGLPTDDDWRNL